MKKKETYFSLRVKEGLVGAGFKLIFEGGQPGSHPEEENPRAEALRGTWAWRV